MQRSYTGKPATQEELAETWSSKVNSGNKPTPSAVARVNESRYNSDGISV